MTPPRMLAHFAAPCAVHPPRAETDVRWDVASTSTGLVFLIERFAVHDGPGIRVAVFLKGCALRCAWCHSPESQSTRPELLLRRDRCIACGTCPPVCRTGAIREIHAGFETDLTRCDACGDCAAACPTDARLIAGRRMTVPELLREIERDRIFLDRSSGGVTFSGGEPLLQGAFLAEALSACRAAGFHTAVETAGFGPTAALEALDRADLVLFDLKLFDEDRHRRATGVSNRLILANFGRLTSRHRQVRARLPLIPGVNDDDENVDAIGALVASVGVRALDLLPYHTAGVAKYARMGRPYALPDTAPPAPAALAATASRLEQFGLTVHVGGSR
jgi:pyruvate formate lyase activating enzyme